MEGRLGLGLVLNNRKIKVSILFIRIQRVKR